MCRTGRTGIFQLVFLIALFAHPLYAQGQTSVRDTTLDLSVLSGGAEWAVFNRKATAYEDDQYKNGVYLDENPGSGVAWLPSFELVDGVVELDLKGKNEVQRSFVGLAFHGTTATSYEAIYLRPFNFRAESEAARSHSIQYVVFPSHEWRRLRMAHPGQYEAAITPAPDPDAWMHLRVELDGGTVRAFVNRSEQPTLVVDRIGAEAGGWIGLWVGSNSDGAFANLKVTPKQVR